MASRNRFFVVLFATAAVGITMFVAQPAEALWQTGSCGNGNQLGINPTTNRPVRVSVQPQLFWSPDQLMWMWVCADDGGTAGAHSVGTAGYYWVGTTGGGYGQHIVHCIGAGCDDVWVGAAIRDAAAGTGGGGGEACTGLEVRSDCEKVRVTITPPSAGAISTSTNNPSGGGFCGVSVASTCTGRELVVTTGGTAVTVNATGTVPFTQGAAVPVLSACVNKYGLVTNPVAVNPASSC